MVASATQRYAYLDGIRGVAALFVVMRHTTELWTFMAYRTYLAVDIFFILSGFVIANAYGRKMAAGTLSLRGFVLVRLIRLYPVYFLSLCLAVPIYLHGLAQQGTPLSVAGALQLTALSLLILPAGVVAEGLLFPVNGPYWSLFYELIANFLYAVARPLLSPRVLAYLISFLGLILLAASIYQGNMDFGFIFAIRGFIAGVVRASFGIFFGILLHSQRERWGVRPRPWLAIAMVCGVFLVPTCGRYDFVVDILALYLIFPACVLLAAATGNDAYAQVMLFLGSASYPVYVLHEPLGKLLLIATDGYAATLAPYSGWLFLLCLLPLASLLETRADEPVRRRLSRLLLGKGRG